ncbi:hypothetical protein HDK77DRAFT_68696 [Phyllosticta capitalensis]
MDAGADAPSDSTDWLSTALPGFAQLENALRCQVCKDLFNTPMITSCSHTFCSLCIRRCFAHDSKCPTCRTNGSDSKLRRNWTAQEMVDVWQGTRQKALDLARGMGEPEQGPKTKKRKLEVPDSEGEDEIEDEDDRPRRKTRSSARQSRAQTRDPEIIELEDSEHEEEAEPNDGLVACPMCNRRMKEEAVFPHLDKCTGPQPTTRSTRNSDRSRTSTDSPHFPQQHALGARASSMANNPPPTRLPQLTYSLFTETKLRKKLKELGIPNTGPRALLVRRHTEWINLWNANCDSTRPLSKRQLLSELQNWERSQGGGQSQGGLVGRGSGDVMDKEFQRDGWAETNKGQYDDLIAQARSRIKRDKEAAAAAAAENQQGEDAGQGAAENQPEKDAQQEERENKEHEAETREIVGQREETEAQGLNGTGNEQQVPSSHEYGIPNPPPVEPISPQLQSTQEPAPPFPSDAIDSVRAKVDQTSLHSSQLDQTINDTAVNATPTLPPWHDVDDAPVDATAPLPLWHDLVDNAPVDDAPVDDAPEVPAPVEDAVMTDVPPVEPASIPTSASAPDPPPAGTE